MALGTLISVAFLSVKFDYCGRHGCIQNCYRTGKTQVHQLRLVVEIPLFTTGLGTISGGDRQISVPGHLSPSPSHRPGCDGFVTLKIDGKS